MANSGDTVVLAPAGDLLDPDVGSDYERPWRLAEGLAKRGFRVVIVAREVKRMQDLGRNVEIECPPGRPPASPLGKILDRPNLYWHARRIAFREIASGRAFAVHHLGPCGEHSPSLIGKIPVPFVYGPLPASRPGDPRDDEWLSWLLAPNATAGQTRISKVVAASAGGASHRLWLRTIRLADSVTVEALANVPNGRRDAEVIPPGTDIVQFSPRAGDVPVPGRVIAVGRLLGRKSYDVLIRAIGRVVQTYPAAHLILVGSGPQELPLRALASQLGISPSVTFAGNVPREGLPRLLRSAEIFCHPATWDNVPFAPLEAMACGLPAIVSSSGALPEIVGPAGIVHTAGDDQDLASHLLEVLTNRGLRRALATAARARVIEHFTWDGMCDSYVALYRRLVQIRGPR